jgi:hypothetical protein
MEKQEEFQSFKKLSFNLNSLRSSLHQNQDL